MAIVTLTATETRAQALSDINANFATFTSGAFTLSGGPVSFTFTGASLLATMNGNTGTDGFYRFYVGSGAAESSAALVTTSTSKDSLGVYGNGQSFLCARDVTNNQEVMLGTINSQGIGFVGTISNHPFTIKTNNADALVIDTSGNMTIGDSNTSARLQVMKTTEQLRILYDSSNYYKTTVSSAGAVTFDAAGASAGFTFADPILSNAKITQYNSVTTTGWGVPAVYGTGRSTAQVAAVASVAAYTVGAADGSFLISANVLVTTATLHSFTATVTYTDEGNTSRTVTMQFSTLAGAFVTAMTNAQGTVPYEGVPLHIRAKASTAITIATTGTFTTVVYNVEGIITQIA